MAFNTIDGTEEDTRWLGGFCHARDRGVDKQQVHVMKSKSCLASLMCVRTKQITSAAVTCTICMLCMRSWELNKIDLFCASSRYLATDRSI